MVGHDDVKRLSSYRKKCHVSETQVANSRFCPGFSHKVGCWDAYSYTLISSLATRGALDLRSRGGHSGTVPP